ncbi:MAG: hypothetical protein PHN31_01875 [Candidatus Gracilibacteria bacterium]|nr:hypothetical protein [Candidatus Gracilibacteria bacterium]
MEKVKVRYTGKGHTMVKINGEKTQVLEGGVIDIDLNDKVAFLGNGFEQVGGKSKSEIENAIKVLELTIDKERQELEKSIKAIETELFTKIDKLQKTFDNSDLQNKNKLSVLNEELERVEEDEEIIDEDNKQKLSDLAKQVENKANEPKKTKKSKK